MKKGISTVIATLLMLVITIALAGFAYTYLGGVVSARTGVVFDIIESTCFNDFIQLTVRNEGTNPSGTITVTATAPDGATSAGSCLIAALNGGTQDSITDAANPPVAGLCADSGLDRPAGAGGTAGTYRLRVSSAGASPASGTVFCSTQAS